MPFRTKFALILGSATLAFYALVGGWISTRAQQPANELALVILGEEDDSLPEAEKAIAPAGVVMDMRGYGGSSTKRARTTTARG